MEVKELRRASSILLVAANSSDGDLAISTSHGTIDSTNLIVTGLEFLFRFFNPDQSFSQSDQNGTDCACTGIAYDIEVQYVTNSLNHRTHIVDFSIVTILGQNDWHGHPTQHSTVQ